MEALQKFLNKYRFSFFKTAVRILIEKFLQCFHDDTLSNKCCNTLPSKQFDQEAKADNHRSANRHSYREWIISRTRIWLQEAIAFYARLISRTRRSSICTHKLRRCNLVFMGYATCKWCTTSSRSLRGKTEAYRRACLRLYWLHGRIWKSVRYIECNDCTVFCINAKAAVP